MKVLVTKSFRDKYTNRIVRKGKEIEIEEERFSELTGPSGIFVELVDVQEGTIEKDNLKEVNDSKEENAPKEKVQLVEKSKDKSNKNKAKETAKK